MGMVAAAGLACRLGVADKAVQERIRDLVTRAGLPTEMPGHSPAAVIRAMRQDKKVKDGQMHFVLPTRIGHVRVEPVSESSLWAFLRDTDDSHADGRSSCVAVSRGRKS